MIEFGQKCHVTKKLRRVIARSETSSRFKKWIEKDCVMSDCVFLGIRHLKNGNSYFDSDEGYSYVTRELVKAALVCAKNRKPFYVPVGCVFADGEKP